MPRTTRQKPLYQRGEYALYRRPGRANLEIVWYDAERKRERSISAGTAEVGPGKLALDREYLKSSGKRICPTCHRPWDHEGSPPVAVAIDDYLIAMEGRAGEASARNRLAHVTDYLIESGPETKCADVDVAWVDGFRAWIGKRSYKKGTRTHPYSLSQIEGCVMQLAAAINAMPGERAQFRPVQQKEVAASPRFRATVPQIAAMFNFCLRPEGGRTDKENAMISATRANLLAYLRIAVATWARPDAIYEVNSEQWHSDAQVLELNPRGRRQTKKYRPTIPVPRQFAPWLDDLTGNWLAVSSVRHAWDAMRAKLGLPGGSQAGEKLIRRSMATIARKRIGEANWRQGEMMLGHVKASISDIYAIPDPANLGLALAATEAIIDEIEALAPGAFYRIFTADKVSLKVVSGGGNR
ncbi:MAG TPA: hypothetical protein VF503_21515 [Sphingobium sp.]|uniref:hypothetical protein n=1 Tax=Sphingobium sp. TaxID=1912891 RepID=UPI002ED5B39D